MYEQGSKKFIKELKVPHLFSSLVLPDLVILGSHSVITVLFAENLDILTTIKT